MTIVEPYVLAPKLGVNGSRSLHYDVLNGKIDVQKVHLKTMVGA